ncbi:hypothetical protein B566_EDAN010685 [Ephemera danica]|nr:hypothetical protein B566_EDAN010685 [Ephemera danica]
MARTWLLLLPVLVCQLVATQTQNIDRLMVEHVAAASRAARSQYPPLSPAELLQRVTAARAAFVTSEPKEVEDETTTLPNRAYRKQYSRRPTGSNNNKQNDATNVRNLLKQFGPASLSEVLQQKNISLSEFLQNKKLQLTLLAEQQQNVAALSPEPRSTTEPTSTTERVEPRKSYLGEHSLKRPVGLYNVEQRSSYLQQKRTTTTESPQDVWVSPNEEERIRGDSREDILELLQPGSPVSLAMILSSRNMTLAELMEHRERGSRQQQLADLFSDVALKNTSETTPKPSRRRVDIIIQQSKARASRDPRLLDLPRRNAYIVDYAEVVEETTTRNGPEILNYEQDETEAEEEEEGMPMAVKSAIIASGGLLAITLILFAVIFACCKIRQRKRRGSRTPFLRNSRLARSERSVEIKPVTGGSKSHDAIIDF